MNSKGSIQINFAIMILYCCCLDVDDDTDSHTSCSRSCFGSFYFIMLLSARDVRINGVVSDILGHATNRGIEIQSIDCTPRTLLRFAEDILLELNFWALPFGVQEAVIDSKGHLIVLGSDIFPKLGPTINVPEDELPF